MITEEQIAGDIRRLEIPSMTWRIEEPFNKLKEYITEVERLRKVLHEIEGLTKISHAYDSLAIKSIGRMASEALKQDGGKE